MIKGSELNSELSSGPGSRAQQTLQCPSCLLCIRLVGPADGIRTEKIWCITGVFSVVQTLGESKDSIGGLLRMDSIPENQKEEHSGGTWGRNRPNPRRMLWLSKGNNGTQNREVCVLGPVQSLDHRVTGSKSLGLSGLSLHICRTRSFLRPLLSLDSRGFVLLPSVPRPYI